ncbi:VIT1/CCC1 transporter family protein [Neoroseomonas oryzicola]|uniref:Iron transporter n=2 Tax=Neoroseomonas oryzicola TaxID=535904 RepID=A0ABX1EKH0_9PROT|nr:VIT1/CCC1 transporter family protein [Neoroseomonas oryzicola]NKE16814.1 iron transporter [Neoroseomonas oryzicola]
MDSATQTPKPEALNRDGLWPMPPGPPHEEQHIAEREVVRDLVGGAADGLVVPFAVVAVLAGVAAPAAVPAGVAAAVAGGVALGLGRYLAARAETEHYAAERRREEEETVEYEDRERWEVAAILHRYGVRGDALRLAVDSICSDTKRWVDFMMRFELDLKEPEPVRAARGAATAGAAAAVAGLLPVLPFLGGGAPGQALMVSALLTGAGLVGFGWLKARGEGQAPIAGALQRLLAGGIAAAAALVARMAAG